MRYRPWRLPDDDGCVGLEGVRRHREIVRRRTFADAPGSVVLRAMAGAEPAAELAAHIRGLLPLGDATQMGADAHQDKPLRLARLDAVAVGLRILEDGQIHVLGRLDLLGRAPA